MGCVNSKKTVAGTYSPDGDVPHVRRSSRRCDGAAVSRASSKGNSGVRAAETAREGDPKSEKNESAAEKKSSSGEKELKRKESTRTNGSLNMRVVGLSSRRVVEGEQIAAGWPPWLASVAGEAIQGWVPLKTDSFEKLDKIGQGTYSSVFQAREVETGRLVALKKVRFDNLQPESIRFMAREIIILRTLDHPNIMKLEGIITSQLSHSIYLVFEYMEHDLAGLVSSPDIKFSEAQIKCYMRQLLSGLEHCHLRGIMHRDIKVSNILVNNEGVLKIGDFGLANNLNPNNKNPLTSRVVTLWYRPPELLMGSTSYGVSVDLWSVGCVFAELFLGKPILKGRNEVEQLHKIFKLCGSPPDEFWKKCKLPLATMFKPQTNYESSLQERCKGFPATAVSLIETLLSIDPCKRGTASSALMSEYFSTQPYACNPALLPKYPPSKEMDAKNRDELQRKKSGVKPREALTSKRQRRGHKVSQEPNNYSKPTLKEETQKNISQNASKDDDKDNAQHTKGRAGPMLKDQPPKPSFDAKSEADKMTNGSNGGYTTYSGPAPLSGSSGFTWVKKKKEAPSTLSDGSRSKISGLDPNFAKGTYDLTKRGTDVSERNFSFNAASHQDDTSKHAFHKQQARHAQRESFDVADMHSNYLDFDPNEKADSQLSTQGHINDDIFHWNENSLRRTVRKSRFG